VGQVVILNLLDENEANQGQQRVNRRTEQSHQYRRDCANVAAEDRQRRRNADEETECYRIWHMEQRQDSEIRYADEPLGELFAQLA
jgi:hypothetical protein